MKLAILSTLLAGAAAFVPASAPLRASTTLQESGGDLRTLAKNLNPVVGYYDPWKLSEQNFWGSTEEEVR